MVSSTTHLSELIHAFLFNFYLNTCIEFVFINYNYNLLRKLFRK